jgi:hypothetical protein
MWMRIRIRIGIKMKSRIRIRMASKRCQSTTQSTNSFHQLIDTQSQIKIIRGSFLATRLRSWSLSLIRNAFSIGWAIRRTYTGILKPLLQF